ncbi:MAG: hypothetical protein P8X74_02065 [Reinekea sp.]
MKEIEYPAVHVAYPVHNAEWLTHCATLESRIQVKGYGRFLSALVNFSG